MSIPETSMDAVPCLLELTWPLQHLQLWHCLPKPRGLQAMGILRRISPTSGIEPTILQKMETTKEMPCLACVATNQTLPQPTFGLQPRDFDAYDEARGAAPFRRVCGRICWFQFPFGNQTSWEIPEVNGGL